MPRAAVLLQSTGRWATGRQRLGAARFHSEVAAPFSSGLGKWPAATCYDGPCTVVHLVQCCQIRLISGWFSAKGRGKADTHPHTHLPFSILSNPSIRPTFPPPIIFLQPPQSPSPNLPTFTSPPPPPPRALKGPSTCSNIPTFGWNFAPTATIVEELPAIVALAIVAAPPPLLLIRHHNLEHELGTEHLRSRRRSVIDGDD